MFDVFDIQLSVLATQPAFERRRRESAFGTSDDEFLYVHGVKFATVLGASKAYGDVAFWTGSSDRSSSGVCFANPIAISTHASPAGLRPRP